MERRALNDPTAMSEHESARTRHYRVDDVRIGVLFIKATQVVDIILLIRREFDRDHADPVPHRE